jgi:hypothetical protein
MCSATVKYRIIVTISYFLCLFLLNHYLLPYLVHTVFTRVIFTLAYFFQPNFSSVFREFSPHISQPSILHLRMVTHSYCGNCKCVTSFVLQECGISAIIIRTLGLYYNAETFHFKFMNRIPNSGPNLKVASKKKRLPKIYRSFHTPLFTRKSAKKV